VLMAASAIPYGLLVKRVWKSVYEAEAQPRFLTIDPHQIQGYQLYEFADPSHEMNPIPSQKKIEEGDRVLIFDEYTRSQVVKPIKYDLENSPENIRILARGEKGDLETGIYNLFLAAQEIKRLNRNNEVWLDSYAYDDFMFQLARKYPVIERKSRGDEEYGFFRKPSGQDTNPEYEKSKKQFLEDLKKISERISTNLRDKN
jgi:hypothetical protein